MIELPQYSTTDLIILFILIIIFLFLSGRMIFGKKDDKKEQELEDERIKEVEDEKMSEEETIVYAGDYAILEHEDLDIKETFEAITKLEKENYEINKEYNEIFKAEDRIVYKKRS